MQSIVIGNFKGGVGKSFISVQLTYFFALKMGLRTLIVDTDAQKNTTQILLKNPKAAKVCNEVMASELFSEGKEKAKNIPAGKAAQIRLIPGDDGLRNLERQGEEHYGEQWLNFVQTLHSLDKDYDVCIIDTAPAMDSRLFGSIAAANYLLSPIELKEESINGIAAIRSVWDSVNSGDMPFDHYCRYLGVLINRFQPNSQQRKNLRLLTASQGAVIFSDEKKIPYVIPESKIYALAQEQGLPVWEVKNDTNPDKSTHVAATAKALWLKLQPAFARIACEMRLKSQLFNPVPMDMNAKGAGSKEEPGTNARGKKDRQTEDAVPTGEAAIEGITREDLQRQYDELKEQSRQLVASIRADWKKLTSAGGAKKKMEQWSKMIEANQKELQRLRKLLAANTTDKKD